MESRLGKARPSVYILENIHPFRMPLVLLSYDIRWEKSKLSASDTERSNLNVFIVFNVVSKALLTLFYGRPT